MKVMNEAGETMTTVSSDAEAVRWWLEQGRRGDYLDDTGETVHSVVWEVFPMAHFQYDRSGAVVVGTTGEDALVERQRQAKELRARADRAVSEHDVPSATHVVAEALQLDAEWASQYDNRKDRS